MMSKFIPRWSRWNAVEDTVLGTETANQQACKTSRSPFAGFAGALVGRPELSTALADRQEPGCVPKKRASYDLERAEIESMDLATFATASLVVRMQSRILGCSVLLVSDDVPHLALGGDSPTFRAAELRKLAILRPPPHDLQVIHDVKTIFDGVITDVQQRDGLDND